MKRNRFIIKNKIVIGVFIQKRICHSLHHCASSACKTLPRSCEDLAREIFNYFKSSSKRICQYKEFQEFCNVSPHKILYPVQTRWLSLLLSSCQSNSRTVATFEMFFTSNWYKDRLKSFDDLNDQSIFIYLIFLQWVLPK